MHLSQSTYPNALQREAIIRLWNEEYPHQMGLSKPEDLDAYLNGLQNKQHFFLSGNDGYIHGWLLLFTRDGDTWFAMILDEATQGLGHGTALLNLAKKNVLKLHGWIVDHNRYTRLDGRPYRSPLDFYIKNQFRVHPASRLELQELSAVRITWTKELI